MQINWQLNEQKGVRELRTGENRVIAKVPAGTVIRKAEASLIFPASEKMFFNGFQSWTHCPEYSPSDRIRIPGTLPGLVFKALSLDHFADYHFVRYPNRRGMLHGVSYCYFRERDRYRLLASLDEKPGYTLFNYDCRENLLTLERDSAGTAAGEEGCHVFDLFYMEGSETDVFDGWFRALGIHNRMPPLSGYSSWYNHYTKINTRTILEDLEGARKLFSEGDLFQIDDGWESAVGDWETVNERKFPGGLRPVTERIHSAGFKAGLWLAPFSCERRSRLFKNHPDRLLKYQNKPWKNGPNWSGHYSLDIDDPEVIDHLAGVFRRIFEDWKFDLVKLDFLYAAAPFASGDHGSPSDIPFSESRASRMIRAMKLLRELCDGKLILSCGVPLMPAFGLTDYCRVGCDMSLNWDDFPVMRLLHRERVSTRQSVINTFFRRQLNGRAFGSDPDVFFLRDKNIFLSGKEKNYLAAANALFGSVWLTSDDLNSYDAEKTAQYWALARLRAAERKEIDPDTLDIRYTLDGRQYEIPFPHRITGKKR